MMEKRLKNVAPQAFTLGGTINGVITIIDARLFKVKQKVIIRATALPDLNLEVKRVYSSTQIAVGEIKHPQGIDHRTDLSAYTLATSPYILANEQPRPSVPEQEVERSTYEEEPTVARRVMLVDILGDRADYIRDQNGINRLAVDANISMTGAQINIDHPDKIKVSNILVPAANTEIAFILQPKTDKFAIKVRDGVASIKLAFNAGETSTDYFKVNRGAVFNSGTMELTAPTSIYFSVDVPNVTVEIVNWYFT